MREYLKNLKKSICEIIENGDKIIVSKYRKRRLLEDPLTYKKEFCSLHLNLPRQHGNTTLAIALFKHFKESLLITINADAKSYIASKVKKKHHKRIHSKWCILPEEKEIIIVDGSSLFTEKDFEKIYNIKAEFYIFLG